MEKIKLAIDPGHGMGNAKAAKPTVYDPGATSSGQTEAGIVLSWGLTLKAECVAESVPCWMSRHDANEVDYVGTRDDRAEAAGCSHFVAIHCNAADDPAATGVEVFYRDSVDKMLAKIVLDAAVRATGLKVRGTGVKVEGESQHDRLAVLDFNGAACLVELGFITNPTDRAKLLSRDVRIRFAELVIAGLQQNACTKP